MQKFEPAELEVKLEGNRLVVRGKHEQRADEHGYVTREFKREFDIPEVQFYEVLFIFVPVRYRSGCTQCFNFVKTNDPKNTNLDYIHM